MKTLKYIFLSLPFFIKAFLFSQSITDQTMITVHGFLGAPWNFKYLTRCYVSDGVEVINWAYPSKDKTIEEHAADLALELQKLAEVKPGSPINFLTHSMGGLVLRSALNHPQCPPEAKIGRAVLLAPPNQGACWGKMLDQFAFARAIVQEQSGKQLFKENDFEHLGQFPDTMAVMVIAGNLSLNPFLSGDNDGAVTVEETFLTTPHRHEIVKAGHKTILLSGKAAKIAKEFFEADF